MEGGVGDDILIKSRLVERWRSVVSSCIGR